MREENQNLSITYPNHSILIVDDEKDMRQMLCMQLSRYVGSIHTAESAYEALELLETKNIDVALLDLRMPGMGGLELLNEIHNLYPHLKSIILTAYADKEKLMEAFRLHAFDFVTKLFNKKRLFKVVEDAIKARETYKLTESVSFYKAVFDSSQDYVVIIDNEYRFLYINKSALNLFQVTTKGVVGKKVYDADINTMLLKSWKTKINYLMNKPIPYSEEEKIQIGAHDYYFESNAFPIRNEEKAILGYGIIMRDISLNKQTELELEHRKEELEQKNITLKNVLSQIEAEKTQVRENISINIERNIKPIIHKLKKTKFHQNNQEYLNYIFLVEKFLNEINNEFYKNIENLKVSLTPTELRICHLIKSGYSMKEVSSMLSISENTTKNHLKNIRRKLGITKNKISLKKFFNSPAIAD